MQRILDLAYKALTSTAGLGFEIDSYGMYFLIREKGTTLYLNTRCNSNTEGIQLKLCGVESPGKAERQSMVTVSSFEGIPEN
ncbi:hypothetical protein FIBSPDRAFT_36733 [Athelia psychrophila]|uniref:Uncharacterized protein n=1 Tax=Athelia psychrophila TaxID=1759441 RepID=A0A166FMU8_9AGAM|nr:hypothetical protein FIBSPDRAFT_36733 [Fibularhizoctonia sp. CBS 109695]